MNDIFISYSRRDSNVVGEFVWRFEQEGFKVWIDKEGIYSGDEFAEVLATAIEESTVVVYFSSADSNASRWVAGEIGIANMYDKHIIPVRLDHSPYNKKSIIHLVNRDYIDYTEPQKHPEMMEKLIKVLREICPKTDSKSNSTNVDIELYVQEHDGKMGYTDNTGNTVIPFIYDEVEKFYGGLARVHREGHWGYINKSGIVVIPLKYNYVELFSEDYAVVILDGKYGFVDKTGKEVIPLQYDNASSFSGGLAVVEKEGKFGYINKQGEATIPFEFDGADVFSEGFAAVRKNNKWGYLNQVGQLVVKCEYEEAYKVRNGSANVIKNGSWIKISLSPANK